jgi:GT2 family glycosyltransferase
MTIDAHRDSVSVIIPAHNRADVLPRAVKSVLTQTYKPLEVIIVDDGSNDRSAEVCLSYPDTVRYVRQTRSGAAAARNRGIKEAVGDWIAFLDSDDAWVPQKLEVMLSLLHAFPDAKWALSGFSVVDVEDQPLPEPQGFARVFPVFEESRAQPARFFEQALEHKQIAVRGSVHDVFHGDAYALFFAGNFGLPSSAVMRRDFVNDLGGFDPTFTFAEDTEFFHRLSAYSPLILVMSSLVKYTSGRSDATTSSHNFTRMIEGGLRSLDLCAGIRRPLEPKDRRAYQKGRRILLGRLAYARLSEFDRAGARAAVRELWDSTPTAGFLPMAVFLASLAPSPVLRAAHRLKRSARLVLRGMSPSSPDYVDGKRRDSRGPT